MVTSLGVLNSVVLLIHILMESRGLRALLSIASAAALSPGLSSDWLLPSVDTVLPRSLAALHKIICLLFCFPNSLGKINKLYEFIIAVVQIIQWHKQQGITHYVPSAVGLRLGGRLSVKAMLG